jgi:hypothetical protein
MLRSIKSPQRAPRQIHAHIDGTGSVSVVIGSKDVSLVKNATGDYSVTILKPFARAAVAVASPITAGSLIEVASVSSSVVSILAKKRSDGTAVDTDFYLIVQGFDAADEY